jgi:UPF0755 protein
MVGKRRSGCALGLVGVVLLCLVLATTAGYAGLRLPAQAEQKFGPPATGLSLPKTVLYSALLLYQANDLLQPANPSGAEQDFTIQPGESAASISVRLAEDGFIQNPAAFRTFLQYSGLDVSLQAGEYHLSPAKNALEIAQDLQDATPAEVTFQVLPGWRLEEIAAALPTSGLEFSGEEFLQVAQTSPGLLLPETGTLEGFLLPGEYTFQRTISPTAFAEDMVANFAANLTDDLRQGFKRQNLGVFGAVTLASIVQREAVIPDEMPQIAGVFYNRLAAGMKLDSDPTVQYAIGYNPDQSTWWTNPLSLQHLQIESLYNTYIYAGLPPGPIANPSLEALMAVAYPAKSPYYYFRSACDGSGRHVFAETYDEHIRNACP